MQRRLLGFGFVALLYAGSANGANMVNGVSAMTESVGSIHPPGTGQTDLINAGAFIDGLFGDEQAYLADDFLGSLGWGDNLKIRAKVVVNNDGTVNSNDNLAVLGYLADGNHADGDYVGDFSGRLRGQTPFGLAVLGPGGGGERIFVLIGGELEGPVANWNNDFGGRNNPFTVDLSAVESGGVLTVTGTITGDNGTVVNVNKSRAVNPAQRLEAFGVAQGFPPRIPPLQRSFGVDFSDVQYVSTVPEPSTLGASILAIAMLAGAKRRRWTV